MQAARPDPTAALTALSPLATPRSANPANSGAGGFAALMQQAQAAPAPPPAPSAASARAPAREPAREPAQAAPAEASVTPSPEAPADPAAAQRRMTRAKAPVKAEGEAKAPDAAGKPKPQAASPDEAPAAEAATVSPPAAASDTPDASTAADPIPGTATPLALLLGTPIARNLPAAVSDPADTDDDATALRTPALTLAPPPGQADAAAAAATEAAPTPTLLLAAATAHASAKTLASDAANGRRGELGEASLGAGPIGAWAASVSTWSNPTASTSAATATLAPAPGQADFAEALGTQVSLWVGKGVQEAQLQLNPKDMGPVQVWIALDNNAAQVRFAAEHSATREALQAALPELAQALARDGLQLGSASVHSGPHSGTAMGGQGGFAQARQQGDAPADGRRGFLPAQPLSTSPSARAIGSAGANLLDLYA